MQQHSVPYPEAIFELSYFFHNPKPFLSWAKQLYPANYRPNVIHYFLRLLHDKGQLLRLYTQNIDGLERGEALGAAPQRAPAARTRALLPAWGPVTSVPAGPSSGQNWTPGAPSFTGLMRWLPL